MHLDYLLKLTQVAQAGFHRFGVCLQGPEEWAHSLIQNYCQAQGFRAAVKLGGAPVEGVAHYPAKAGTRLLGQEADCLIVDVAEGLDANSLTAASGILTGGHLLFILGSDKAVKTPADSWMSTAWQQLLCLTPDCVPEALPSAAQQEPAEADFSQQQAAVDDILQVLTGHRKRPLVLTADRGRGKSSALGLAAGRILSSRKARVLVCAPAVKSVTPLFRHAAETLGLAFHASELHTDNGWLRFIAPDQLLREKPDCDLLLVDEASALPVPMLKRLIGSYHRMVMSGTVYGYEGCGRGFTLKFLPWLAEQRPGSRFRHLEQPVRWAAGDPLEAWLFDTFLLNCDLDEAVLPDARPGLEKVSAQQLCQQPQLLRRVFALLVNAHYQTSPSDLIQLLADPETELYVAKQDDACIGVISVVNEGGLDPHMIDAIAVGKRRPKGQLVPVTMVNQLGMDEFARLRCKRIMRIAVHPDMQGRGAGLSMLNQLRAEVQSDDCYLATSFGATEELLSFWHQAGYQAVRVGSSRDQASGCHSVVMIHADGDEAKALLEQARLTGWENLLANLAGAGSLSQLEPAIVVQLLMMGRYQDYMTELNPGHLRRLERFVMGGGSQDSVADAAVRLLLNVLSRDDAEIGQCALLCACFIQRWPVSGLVHEFELSGKKQADAEIRRDLQGLLAQFTV